MPPSTTGGFRCRAATRHASTSTTGNGLVFRSLLITSRACFSTAAIYAIYLWCSSRRLKACRIGAFRMQIRPSRHSHMRRLERRLQLRSFRFFPRALYPFMIGPPDYDLPFYSLRKRLIPEVGILLELASADGAALLYKAFDMARYIGRPWNAFWS